MLGFTFNNFWVIIVEKAKRELKDLKERGLSDEE